MLFYREGGPLSPRTRQNTISNCFLHNNFALRVKALIGLGSIPRTGVNQGLSGLVGLGTDRGRDRARGSWV